MKKFYSLLIFVAFLTNYALAQQSKVSHVVLFKSGKFEITESEKVRLDSLLGVLKRWSNYKLSLYGHTDDVGSDETNEKLSQNRVKAVYDYLVIHQYDTSKMATKSFGEKNPVADNNDSLKKSLNRSVEMVFQRYDAKRKIRLDNCLDIVVPEKAYGTIFNDDIDFDVVFLNNNTKLADSKFTTTDDKGNQLTTVGMASIKASYKGKEINKDRKLPLQVTMCAAVQDSFVLYCGQVVKDKIVWSRNGSKLEKNIDHGRVSYSAGIPANCDVFNFERNCNYGADLCACNDPFLYTNLNKENQVGLYTKGVFRSDMGIVVKTDTNESPILTLIDARTTENKVMNHAFENVGSTVAKENVIVNVKNKSGANFSGTIYFTRPIGENKEKYKLYILDESDSLNPVWQAINKPEEEKYTTATCSTFSAQINKSGTYMFVGATGNFDHSVRIKVKKMQTPIFWVLFKDKKKGLPGHVYHTGEGQGIYTIELSGEEKNTSLIVYAYKKGVKYYKTVSFKDLKYKKRKGYYLLKKKDFTPLEKKSDKKIARFAAKFN